MQQLNNVSLPDLLGVLPTDVVKESIWRLLQQGRERLNFRLICKDIENLVRSFLVTNVRLPWAEFDLDHHVSAKRRRDAAVWAAQNYRCLRTLRMADTPLPGAELQAILTSAPTLDKLELHEQHCHDTDRAVRLCELLGQATQLKALAIDGVAASAAAAAALEASLLCMPLLEKLHLAHAYLQQGHDQPGSQLLLALGNAEHGLRSLALAMSPMCTPAAFTLGALSSLLSLDLSGPRLFLDDTALQAFVATIASASLPHLTQLLVRVVGKGRKTEEEDTEASALVRCFTESDAWHALRGLQGLRLDPLSGEALELLLSNRFFGLTGLQKLELVVAEHTDDKACRELVSVIAANLHQLQHLDLGRWRASKVIAQWQAAQALLGALTSASRLNSLKRLDLRVAPTVLQHQQLETVWAAGSLLPAGVQLTLHQE